MLYQPKDILFNKYRIVALIGRGAFAEVYRATHLALNVTRALKILRKNAPGLGNTEYSDFQTRFQLEAQLGAKLDHPNIIRVHDFEQDDETIILVMEYAQAGSLAERLEWVREHDEQIPIIEAVQIALDVAKGLSAIHAMDAVHRDLKPSNVLFDEQGRAKIADLGLAQIPGGPSMRSQLSTGVPHPGTPGYMSPEQASISNYLTPVSDVYALGLVLFEMLTGRVYYSQRPGTRARELQKGIPEWLDDLLSLMLAKDAERRPWDGGEVAGLLQEVMQRENETRIEDQARREAEEKARKEAEESARREMEERARQELEKRNAVLKQLMYNAQSAISQGAWDEAEKLSAGLMELGENGFAKAKEIQESLSQAKLEADRRERQQRKIREQKIADLQRNIETALLNNNWGKAKQIITHLENMGTIGQSAAVRYKDRIPKLWTRIPVWMRGLASIALFLFAIYAMIYIFGLVATPNAAQDLATETAEIAAVETVDILPTYTDQPTNTPVPQPTNTQTPQQATATDSPSATEAQADELLYDSFENDDINVTLWTFDTNGNGYYFVKSGSLVIYSGTISGAGGWLTSRDTFNIWENTTSIKMRVRTDTRNGGMWGLFDNHSQAVFQVRDDGELWARVAPEYGEFGNWEVISNIDPTKWHDYEILFANGAVEFYIDGTLVAIHKDQLPTKSSLPIRIDRVSLGQSVTLSVESVSVGVYR